MARKKNKRIIVKVYINQQPVKTEKSGESSSISPLPLLKSGIFKPVNIMSGGAILLALGELIAHYLGKF